MQPSPTDPIVVEVIKQPPITPELTMGDVVLGAVGFTGAVMIAAAVAGLLAGALFIWFRRRRNQAIEFTDPGHARFRI